MLLLLLPLVGCSVSGGGSDGGVLRSTEDPGYAAAAQAETDRAAKLFLPAVVTDLAVRVRVGLSGFTKCDVEGWRYQADGDLFLSSPDPTALSTGVAEVLGEQELEVETRDDGSVLGRRGSLTVLVGAPLGPPNRRFAHYTFTHECKGYSPDDAAYAEDAPATDYTAYVPPQALYTP